MENKILVILPCYNEAASIVNLIQEFYDFRGSGGYLFDLVVINDCSKDDTSILARDAKVPVIDLPVNLGIGGAMQTGFQYARQKEYDLAVQMDGDGQHPPIELKKLLDQYFSTGENIIIGSRFINKEGFQSSLLRRFGIKYFHWINRLLTGNSIYDITSGFRLYNRKAIELVATSYPDEYPEPEALILFSKEKLSVREVPVVMRERQGGVSSITNFSQLYYMLKVTLAMIFSKIRK
jgi:glycosyltransferase involved in cell wall biosynthesis